MKKRDANKVPSTLEPCKFKNFTAIQGIKCLFSAKSNNTKEERRKSWASNIFFFTFLLLGGGRRKKFGAHLKNVLESLLHHSRINCPLAFPKILCLTLKDDGLFCIFTAYQISKRLSLISQSLFEKRLTSHCLKSGKI